MHVKPTAPLGKMTARDADAICTKIESLIASKISQRPVDADVAQWIANLQPEIADKLAEFGLIPKKEAVKLETDASGEVIDPNCLGPFLDQYFAKRKDVKPATQTVYQRVRRHLVAHFGESKLLKEVTSGDADDWHLYLQNEGLAENTVRRHIGCARQFFKSAKRHKLIDENPFIDLKASLVETPDRLHFIAAVDAYKVLDACPDTEYRLIVALARFGGLRTPSETFALEWKHVDWKAGRITIPSPKTEHHAGHESRVIPIFPELRPYLEKARAEADEQAQFVITSYRSAKKNLRTRFERIIERAGLTPWPRLFQNLRSSRETELNDKFPLQVVVAWIGNSEIVAKRSYLQVTEAHYARGNSESCSALQHPAESTRLDSQSKLAGIPHRATQQEFARRYNLVRESEMGGTGLEPVTLSV